MTMEAGATGQETWGLEAEKGQGMDSPLRASARRAVLPGSTQQFQASALQTCSGMNVLF